MWSIKCKGYVTPGMSFICAQHIQNTAFNRSELKQQGGSLAESGGSSLCTPSAAFDVSERRVTADLPLTTSLPHKMDSYK